uniref:Uncharacterized protein n=1 Tax=Arundo donax TaxID=35708 RepID=A0A0A9C3N4_ARUDO
MMEGMGQF